MWLPCRKVRLTYSHRSCLTRIWATSFLHVCKRRKDTTVFSQSSQMKSVTMKMLDHCRTCSASGGIWVHHILSRKPLELTPTLLRSFRWFMCNLDSQICQRVNYSTVYLLYCVPISIFYRGQRCWAHKHVNSARDSTLFWASYGVLQELEDLAGRRDVDGLSDAFSMTYCAVWKILIFTNLLKIKLCEEIWSLEVYSNSTALGLEGFTQMFEAN